MDKYKIEITPYAKGQMEEIRDYIKYQLMNPDAARNLLLEMRERIGELEYMADSIKAIEEQPWGNHGIKKIIVKNFYLYFWTDKERAVVHVIAATYARRNQRSALEQIEIEKNK